MHSYFHTTVAETEQLQKIRLRELQISATARVS